MSATTRAFLSVCATCLTFAMNAASAETLDCTITNYNQWPYSRATLIKLLPERQRHVIEAPSTQWNGATGEVTTDSDSRLKWRYYAVLAKESGMVATLQYVLIRGSHNLIVRVMPGGVSQPESRVDSRSFQFVREHDVTGSAGLVPVRHITGHCVPVD